MKTVAEMTNTEVVEAVIVHLEAQGRRAAERHPEGGTRCVYFNPEDGTRCAIGGILPLDMAERVGTFWGAVYDVSVEFSEVGEWLGFEMGPDESDAIDRMDFLAAIQRVHDDADNWSETKGFIGHSQFQWILRDYGR